MLRPNGPPPAVAAPKAEEKPKIVEPDYRLWARAHSSDAAVKIMLITSDVVEGKIAGFGLYSVAVETVDGVVVVFKHAMATARERAQ